VNNRVVGRVTGSFGYGYDALGGQAFILVEGEYHKIEGSMNAGDLIGFSLNVNTKQFLFLKNGEVVWTINDFPWYQELYPAVSFASNSTVTIVHNCVHDSKRPHGSSDTEESTHESDGSESEELELKSSFKKIKREPVAKHGNGEDSENEDMNATDENPFMAEGSPSPSSDGNANMNPNDGNSGLPSPNSSSL